MQSGSCWKQLLSLYMIRKRKLNEERGIALLMTVFIVALATIIVFDLGYTTRFDQKAAYAFTEGIQAEYVLKSELNLAQLLLEIPKAEGIREDWLRDPWALIGSTPTLPISGFVGNPRMTIVDASGKIDVNSIIDPSSASPNSGANNPNSPAVQHALFWKNALTNIMNKKGFVREQYDADEHRTIGNMAYDSANQVAIIQDWIDGDKQSYRSASFNGDGIESSMPDGTFYNRPLASIFELLLVPGMTPERLARIAPYVYVSVQPRGVEKRINVNTAPYEVLVAIGFPESQAIDIVQERLNLPINSQILSTLVEGDAQLKRVTTVRSPEFIVIGKVSMPNSTRWVMAPITVSGTSRRIAKIKYARFF